MKRFPVYALLMGLVSLFLTGQAIAVEGDVIVVGAEMSERSKNIVPSEPKFSNLVVCHGTGGVEQWEVRVGDASQYYTTGEYYIHWRMCSGQRRPCRLIINGETVDKRALGEETGGFLAEHLAWVKTGPFTLKKGRNTIRIEGVRHMPHFLGFVVSPSADAPDDDAFRSYLNKLKKQAREAAQKRLYEINHVIGVKTREKLREMMPDVEQILFIRRYTLQSSHYYTDFIDGCVYFGGQLCLLSLEDGKVTPIVPGPVAGNDLEGGIIGRCNLSFDGKKAVFDYKRKIGEGFRIWEVNLDGTGLRPLTTPPADEVERIAKYRLPWMKSYLHHTDDMHPCYLPDGGVAFASTRCEHGILCDGPDRLVTSVIYRMDADGGNMQKLSDNSVSESAPSVMNDGRILYTRWEYVDNGSVTNKGLWAMHPDGSGTVEVGGMSIAFPSVFHLGRAIPGRNDLFTCIGAPHMPLGAGTVMLVDSRKDSRTGAAVSYVTKHLDVRHQWGWDTVPEGAVHPIPPEMQAGRDGRGNTDRGPLYMDPYPISEKFFLVAHNPDKPWNDKKAYGLYLLDENGEVEPFYKDAEYSCWNPIPVREVKTPPRIAPYTRDEGLAKQGLARVVVTDVYRGMDGVERGTIKYLRVNEHVPRHWSARRFWDNKGTPADCYDQQHSVISKKTHLGLKLQHGIVPVEADGSAHFLVAADRNIFLQALDENYMEVQRERTFVNYRAGETRSCVGCHERASELSNAVKTRPIAMLREADRPGPQPGEASGARALHYPTDIQPIWDKHCVSCHGGEKTEGKLDLTGEMTTFFNRSYEQLIDKEMQPIIGENHPKAGNNHYLPPYSLGAHKSKLLPFIGKAHYDVQLTEAERMRVITWLDSNGQFYGGYGGKKNLKYRGEPEFRIVPTFESETKLASNPK